MIIYELWKLCLTVVLKKRQITCAREKIVSSYVNTTASSRVDFRITQVVTFFFHLWVSLAFSSCINITVSVVCIVHVLCIIHQKELVYIYGFHLLNNAATLGLCILY